MKDLLIAMLGWAIDGIGIFLVLLGVVGGIFMCGIPFNYHWMWYYGILSFLVGSVVGTILFKSGVEVLGR